jgi:hypothetical protein
MGRLLPRQSTKAEKMAASAARGDAPGRSGMHGGRRMRIRFV